MAQPDTPQSDLLITIYPQRWDVWRGTAAQFIAEGLVPARIKWPVRDLRQFWEEGNLTCELRRCRPPEMKGPREVWIEGDYWLLRRSQTFALVEEAARARMYEKQRELIRDLWEQTPAGMDAYRTWWEARSDKTFQDFLLRLNCKKPSRRRNPERI